MQFDVTCVTGVLVPPCSSTSIVSIALCTVFTLYKWTALVANKHKGAITSKIKHAIKLKTGPATVAALISILF